MEVIEILTAHLKSIGADGLCCDGCGCGMDDLMPCETDGMKCVPAKRHDCDGTCSGCCSTGENDRANNCYRPMPDTKQMKFQVQELRHEVLAFALMMESELRKKEAERGDSWKIMPPGDLLISATAQMLHAEKAIANGEEYVKHIVHAANYCMMIADVAGGLACGKMNDGHHCMMPAGSSCPDCGSSLIDYSGE